MIVRRESLDHLVVFSEAHLREVLKNYAFYYEITGTRWSGPLFFGLRTSSGESKHGTK
jgi:hypothetical protein